MDLKPWGSMCQTIHDWVSMRPVSMFGSRRKKDEGDWVSMRPVSMFGSRRKKDEGDWVSMRPVSMFGSRKKSSYRRGRRSKFNFGSLISKKKDYNKLKAKAEQEKAAAVKALQDVKNEMAKLAEGVKLSTAQME